MMRIGRAWAGALLVVATPAAANAPWTQSAGHGQIITKLAGFQTSRAFDREGEIRPLGGGGRFRRLDLNPYVEYGFNDRLTGVANLFLSTLENRQNGNTERSNGFGDQEFGLRYRLSAAGDSNPMLAVQGLVKVPLYGNGPGLRAGAGQYDLEGRFLAGYSLPPMGSATGYVAASPGYRWRSNTPANEWRLDLIAGVKPNVHWLIAADVTWIRSVGDIGSSVVPPVGNPGEGQNFERWRAQLAATYFLQPAVGVMVGVYHDLAGRNIAKGTGLFTGLWLRF